MNWNSRSNKMVFLRALVLLLTLWSGGVSGVFAGTGDADLGSLTIGGVPIPVSSGTAFNLTLGGSSSTVTIRPVAEERAANVVVNGPDAKMIRPLVPIAGGGFHSLVVKPDGKVTGWGDNILGQRSVPSDLKNVIAISAGYFHSLALKSDGKVAAWGDNTFGQTTVPSGLRGVVAIASGVAHSMALTGSGTVVVWGTNGWGILSGGRSLKNVTAIAAGSYHNLALTTSGTVAAWGLNGAGQCLVPVDLTHVRAIAAGNQHSLALKMDGKVVAWGGNTSKQCDVPADLSGVIAIAAGGDQSLALKSDGTVVFWGATNGTSAESLTNIVSIAAGFSHCMAVRSDKIVYAWNDNTYGQSVVPSGQTAALPELRCPLAYGDNTIQVTVTSLDNKNRQTYTTTVTRVKSSISTLDAVSLDPETVSLSASVIPGGENFKVSFEYWKEGASSRSETKSFATVSGFDAVGVTGTLSGLIPRTTYYYQAKATSAADSKRVLTGGTLSFTTLPPPLAAPEVTATNAKYSASFAGSGASLAAFLDPNFWNTDYKIEYSATETFDDPLLTGTGSLGQDIGSPTVVTGTISGGSLSEFLFSSTYYWRLVATSAGGSSSLVFRLPSVTPEPAETAAYPEIRLRATVNPNGVGYAANSTGGTVVQWQYGTDSRSYTSITPPQSIGSGTLAVAGEYTLLRAKLSKNATYHYRVVVLNDSGVIYGPDQTFSTSVPSLIYKPAEEIEKTSINLIGEVNPNGLETEVFLQYGPTAKSYGPLMRPLASGTISGPTAVSGTWSLTELTPNTAYHYRLVATNSMGTFYGADQLFSTAPRVASDILAASADTVPGLEGVRFTTFGTPALNDNGNAAFLATITGTGKKPPTYTGIWAERTLVSGSESECVLVALTGSTAVGTGTCQFAALNDPVYNNLDQVAFLGSLKVASGGAAKANASGIWLTDTNGTLNLVARTQDPAPARTGTAVEIFTSFTSLVLPDEGGVVFYAKTNKGEGIWAGESRETLKLLVRKGEVLSSGTVAALSIFVPPTYGAGQSRSFTSDGAVICGVTYADKTTEVLRILADGTISVVAAKNDGSGAEVPGLSFSAFGNPAINDDLNVAFLAALSGTGSKPVKSTGIFAERMTESGTSARLLVALTGGTAADAEPCVFSALSDPVYNNNGETAFLGSLKVGAGGATKANATGIWATGTSGALELVARAADPAGDCPDATYASFTSLVYPDDGGVMFIANLTGDRASGVSKANNQGLWAVDDTGNPKLMIRTGDGLPVDGFGKILSGFTLFETAPSANAQTRAFNRRGEFIYKATFTDGTQALIKADRPQYTAPD